MTNSNDTQRNVLKVTLYNVIFGTDTKAGRNFDIALLLFILTSVALVMAESVPSIGAKYSSQLLTVEWCFSFIFAVEYALRIYCSPSPRKYIFSFFGVVDFIAILPALLALLFPGASYLAIIRMIRLMRIFRVLKLFQYIQESNLLWRSLVQSRRKIFVFFSTVCILTTILGSLMYLIEGPANGFHSIPDGIYWAIVTITTVGYGDIVPSSGLGRSVAAFAMLLGYAIIAIPTGIITSELSLELRRERDARRCDQCGAIGHDRDAKHCNHCGAALIVPSGG